MSVQIPDQQLAKIWSLIQVGSYDQADAALNQAIDQAPEMPGLYFAKSTLYERKSQLDDAVVEIRKAIERNPNSLVYRNWLVCLLGSLNKTQEVAHEAEVTIQISDQVLGHRLADQLQSLRNQQKPYEKSSAFVDWAWQISKRPQEAKQAWLQRVQLSEDFNRLIFLWLSYNRRNLNSLDKLIKAPQDWTRVRELQKQGNGVLLVNGHFGPKLVALDHLLRFGPPSKWLSANVGFGATVKAPGYISIFAERNRAILTLCRHLQDGGLAYIAGDARQGMQFQTLEMFGKSFHLPLGPAVLAYHGKAQPFWYNAHWQGSAIVFELLEGPVAEQGEEFDAYCLRWFQFVGQHLARHLLADPLNYQMDGGITQDFRG